MGEAVDTAAAKVDAVDSTKAKMGESLEKELKNGCCWQKNERSC
jgi:hypothetical protein